jgi:site-specific recombinase XerD
VVATPNARSPKFISAELVVEVLNGMHNECERCMFHAQYDMGLRISELVDLTVGDIPNEKQYDPALEFIPICVNGVKGRGGQKKERITLISRAVLKRIKRYHSSREYKLAPDWDIDDPKKPAFLTANQRKWSVRNASKQFKTSVRRVGMIDTMKTHWLRHGTAYSVLRSDIGRNYQDRMLMLQQMLGHAHLKTTEIYTQISPALLERLTKVGKEINRLDEAEFIREKTYLGPLQHKEKRGHRE